MRKLQTGLLYVVLGAIVLGGAAKAAPVLPIQITGSSASVQVLLDGVQINGPSDTMPVTGSSLAFDSGAPAVVSFSFLMGPSSTILLSTPVDVGLGLASSIVVNSANLLSVGTAAYPAGGSFPSWGFGATPANPGDPLAHVNSLIALNGGSPIPFSFDIVDPTGFLAGALSFTDPDSSSDLSVGDQVNVGIVVALARFLTVDGRVLEVKGDLDITGTVVPEPHSAVLLSMAMLCVGLRLRSRPARRVAVAA